MIVNHTERRVFLHNPKCAGTSLCDWLIGHHGYQNVFHPEVESEKNADGVINRHSWNPPDSCGDYFTWCTVRDPLHRWSSFYRYMQRIGRVEEGQTFESFTTTRLNWLLPQCRWTDVSEFYVRVEQMTAGLLQLRYKNVSKLKVLNRSAGVVEWTPKSLLAVTEFYYHDFRRFGYLIPCKVEELVPC